MTLSQQGRVGGEMPMGLTEPWLPVSAFGIPGAVTEERAGSLFLGSLPTPAPSGALGSGQPGLGRVGAVRFRLFISTLDLGGILVYFILLPGAGGIVSP